LVIACDYYYLSIGSFSCFLNDVIVYDDTVLNIPNENYLNSQGESPLTDDVIIHSLKVELK
jgi:hypothetical protein